MGSANSSIRISVSVLWWVGAVWYVERLSRLEAPGPIWEDLMVLVEGSEPMLGSRRLIFGLGDGGRSGNVDALIMESAPRPSCLIVAV